MKAALLFLFLCPLALTGQCYGSFEVFGAGGLAGVPNTFTEDLVSRHPVSAYRLGFGASFRVGERTYVRTSLQFASYGSRTSGGSLRWGSQHDGNGGFDPSLPAPSHGVETRERHFFGEGVLALRYQFKSWSRLRPFVEGGLGLAKYGTTYETTKTSGVTTTGTTTEQGTNANDAFRPVNLIGRLGAGLNYNFNEHVGLYGQPVLQYHLRSLTERGLARVHPWQLTLELGVRVFVDPR